MRRSLLETIGESDLSEFSVLDVGAGSGELLKEIALFARSKKANAFLAGLDLNELSARSIADEGKHFPEINAVRGTALDLPFVDNAFDFAICSLFTHHFTDDGVVEIPPGNETCLTPRRLRYRPSSGTWSIPCIQAFLLCISDEQAVRDDGLLSIRKGFQPDELRWLRASFGIRKRKRPDRFPGPGLISAS